MRGGEVYRFEAISRALAAAPEFAMALTRHFAPKDANIMISTKKHSMDPLTEGVIRICGIS
jgi:hypothetical protein